MAEFEFLSASDKPALVAVNNAEWQPMIQGLLTELGYKVHVAADFKEFANRFGSVQYQVVVIEENYCSNTLAENETLTYIQTLPMAQRRHCTFFLIGASFQTMHIMQAYQQSVHAVVNPAELFNLAQVVQRVVAENDLFMNIFRDTQRRMAEGKI